ncbi:DNA-binding NtrC family response regulator [Sinobacterium caligoides]|uniref:DNA-binding NtrC family response regulator n=1 Tax=Sinobacterium caligoides TaxID=933926 RepID=A0A3N2DFR2_9GAMM|nr:sigma-54 dependent transcriptional regulator [Sinobacterium caligoides]ROR98632.1 DNA-binding NtrC family response regulator [Sinobacterium caligoides]
MSHVLIVEDETVIRNALRRLLERHGYTVSEAASVKDALENHDFNNYQLIVSDLRLPGGTGTDLIAPAGKTPVLIMTSYASLRSAVDSMKMGAVDYIAKPFDHDDMLESVSRIIRDRTPKTKRPNVANDGSVDGIIGHCESMQSLYQRIHKVAPTTATVLIQGETGTGKELVARAIHSESERADKPLISVNCAAIPENLIESELFGYEKGAFTGANTSRVGLIEAADGGTLFLDEIGELPLEAQARLLRFLQEGEIRAIGSIHTKKVDVRLIAATHRNLKEQSLRSQFREDLYYRIAVMQLTLPPLRERGSDILEIAENFLNGLAQRFNKPELHFTPSAIQSISRHRWPGNVRELQNAVERAVILCDNNEVSHELLDITPHKSNHQLAVDNYNTNVDIPNQPIHDTAEELSLEDYFQRFVLEHQDSMSETELARKLGVSRKCLWERRQRFGIPRKKNNKANA